MEDKTQLDEEPISKQELLEIIERAGKEKWKKLNLSRRGISELPLEIGGLTELTYLNLGDTLGRFHGLTNSLTKLPSEIGNLTNLRFLNLSSNKLTDIPVSLSRLTALTVLDLRSNGLKALPGD